MPIYEYICLDCRHKFDVLRGMSYADEPLNCEICASDNCSRLISVFFSHSDSRTATATTQSSCGSCSANSCAGCSR
ncbi:MAG: zinc ribbon domain-containing protein [Anaerolineales bacterium]|nr:MAG: zinc ribbon domain-containing protein [Anaerolineales bacterium]